MRAPSHRLGYLTNPDTPTHSSTFRSNPTRSSAVILVRHGGASHGKERVNGQFLLVHAPNRRILLAEIAHVSICPFPLLSPMLHLADKKRKNPRFPWLTPRLSRRVVDHSLEA